MLIIKEVLNKAAAPLLMEISFAIDILFSLDTALFPIRPKHDLLETDTRPKAIPFALRNLTRLCLVIYFLIAKEKKNLQKTDPSRQNL